MHLLPTSTLQCPLQGGIHEEAVRRGQVFQEWSDRYWGLSEINRAVLEKTDGQDPLILVYKESLIPSPRA